MGAFLRGFAASAASAAAVATLAACGPAGPEGDEGSQPQSAARPTTGPEHEIITVLSKDGIPAIDHPDFWSAEEANDFYSDDDLVIGLERDGEAKAYSLPHLSRHEIVNDVVGGAPISVTW